MGQENKTKPTNISISQFLNKITPTRQEESMVLIDIMKNISKMSPVMWGPSIIGFGLIHYKYDSGREGDIPIIAFSPRKTAITIYFYEGFEHHQINLSKLGKYKSSVSCLYINKLEDIDMSILRKMIEASFKLNHQKEQKPTTAEEYINSIPEASKQRFMQLREITLKLLPEKTKEVLSYGILGFKTDDKRPKVYISGWKEHISIYPVPKDIELKKDISRYIKGKGTVSISNSEKMPISLIKRIIKALIEQN
jgi:uncharacterized protein YdhG (YjbR/CyaY superfamily)